MACNDRLHSTVMVNVAEPYEVQIGINLLSKLLGWLSSAGYSKFLVLVDERVLPHLKPVVLQALADTAVVPVAAGEENKHIDAVVELWRVFKKHELDRRSLVVNIGGGALTDLAAFAASTYMRGIAFIQVPTTLLAMVDASVGGKTGINFESIKNLIGTFQQPKRVVVDVSILSSLPRRHLVAGVAEMIKHGIIASAEHYRAVLAFDWQSESLDLVALATLVSESCAIKAAIVASDEREQGVRKALNFGHTLGHALEAYSLTREPLYHGEAVALGMLGELSLAVQMGVCNSDLLTDLRCGLEKVGLPIKVPFKADLEKLYQLTKLDKKNVSSAVNFSLPEQLGKCRIDCSADRELILQVFGQLIA